ncbi:amylo-alpha-1,6-glucosidase [Parafrigoribacterium soli]|uniref:amylo-alpha-1,6-glucosidase n=1 Tax=Parafrigoribacterium soli TaxID=3144663 RepID=UPI0032ED421B
MSPRTGVDFDIAEIPFSMRGSWLDLSPVVALNNRQDDIHLVSHQSGMHGILRLVPERDGARVSTENSATPATLAWRDEEGGRIEAVFESLDTIRLRGQGLQLRLADAGGKLTPFTGTFLFRDPRDGSAIFTSYESGRRYRVTSISGELRFDGAEALGAHSRAVIASGADGWELAVEEFESARVPYSTSNNFEALVARSAAAFDDYAELHSSWRGDAPDAAERAAYVLWSATVAPRGFLRRESVLMSKHWMDKLWSWDHCFNAFAFAPADLDAAMDQFLAPFDLQDASGALPDSITHSEVLYNFVKPPIHGWAFTRIRERANSEIDRSVVEEVYLKLARWTRFWLDFRRAPGHALAHYQHGNDSGWDNSTAFDNDRVIESPDLAAFLVIQLDVLAELATELGVEGAEEWADERDTVLSALLELWDGEHFFARSVEDGRRSKTTSLLTLLPILAAKYLPTEITTKLAADIAEHVTPWGPATQRLDSPEYESDGYWRGPIWAPSTVIIEDGLRRAGHVELADRVSEGFRSLCERSGFAENFDAVTGEGLRDRAYTWTASAYLLLAHEASVRRPTSRHPTAG